MVRNLGTSYGSPYREDSYLIGKYIVFKKIYRGCEDTRMFSLFREINVLALDVFNIHYVCYSDCGYLLCSFR